MLMLVVAASLRTSHGMQSARIIAVTAAIAFVPITIAIAVATKSGRWQNADASRPAERPLLFTVSLCVVAVLIAVVLIWHPATFLARGAIAAGALIVVAWVLLRWIKLSLHVAFTAYAAVAMLAVAPLMAALLAAAIPVVVWARLRMTRHVVAEVVAGALLGFAVGGVFLIA